MGSIEVRDTIVVDKLGKYVVLAKTNFEGNNYYLLRHQFDKSKHKICLEKKKDKELILQETDKDVLYKLNFQVQDILFN